MEGLLLAGQIGKPHGLSGEVYVIRISDDPRRFQPGSRLLRSDGTELVIVSARPHRDRFLVRFEGVDSRTAAESLRGPLYVPGTERRDLEEDEYWPDDLVGCTVVTVSGKSAGIVSDVTGNAAQDLLVLDSGALIPMVKEIVMAVDLETRTITVDPPEGLLDEG